jgi:hypothetical protein
MTTRCRHATCPGRGARLGRMTPIRKVSRHVSPRDPLWWKHQVELSSGTCSPVRATCHRTICCCGISACLMSPARCFFPAGGPPLFWEKGLSLSLSLSLGELARPVRTSSGNHTTLCGSHRAGGLLWCKGNPGSDYTNKYLLDKT